MALFPDFTEQQVNQAINESWKAFAIYKKCALKQRANLMRSIADELTAGKDQVITLAMKETNLPAARLAVELTRTIFQLASYATECEKGSWMDLRIDTENKLVSPARVDIRKTLTPLGPVAVFGASNFPFAYSTAGGDTACALAAGCSVIVKAHPAHPETSEWVANAIFSAIAKNNLPKALFTHIHGAGHETGKAIVMHPLIKAVGFTGSYGGGKALFDWANQRKEPIPVFSEMGSTNPVYLLPEQLQNSAAETAQQYAASITMSVGQFCTNPGIIIGIESEALQLFTQTLSAAIQQVAPEDMLHPGISKAFIDNRAKALTQSGVTTAAVSLLPATKMQGIPTLATVDAINFLNNPTLHQEIFGPYSIIVRCVDENQMLEVAENMEGQLTSTLIATDVDIQNNQPLVETVKSKCGRIILNGVPTGVQVGYAMHHGGPYPATTDSRFTAVGADGIKRFARPLSYQNWPENLLPDELKSNNPLNLWRTVNNELTQTPVST